MSDMKFMLVFSFAEYIGHSHMTFAVVDKVEGGYSLKALKQKQMVDGLCYLLQEIYGIENKNIDRPKVFIQCVRVCVCVCGCACGHNGHSLCQISFW